MALRYHRRGAKGRRGVATGAVAVSNSLVSVGGIARTLHQERIRQGLSLRDVSVRTGIPVSQLHASETGVLRSSDDQISALKAVQHYAVFLGLPGDCFVLALVEHWPTRAAAERCREFGWPALREEPGDVTTSDEMAPKRC